MKTKNLVWTLLIVAMIVASTAVATIPVKASPARVYVSPVVTPGVAPGEYVAVDVMIEGAVDLVQWELDVKVAAAVLEVVGADDGVGTAIYDKYKIPYWSAGSTFMAGTIDTVTGTITDVSQAILSWPGLYPAGKTGYNGTGKLCTLYFMSKNLTAYSPIDLMDVWLYDGLYWQTGEPHRFPADIVEDGNYNSPLLKGAIEGYVKDASTQLPISGASIVANGWSATTDATGYYKISDLTPATYAVTATASGYNPDTKSVVVTAGVTTTQNFALQPTLIEVHDLAVTSVVPSKLSVLVGESVDISVTVENQGNKPETFTVNVKAGATIVGSTTGSLAAGPGVSGTFTVTWTTTAVNSYLISAEVPPVIGETDLTDNSLADGTVVVKPVPIHDIAITSVTAAPTSVYIGDSVTVNVGLKNEGNMAEANVVVRAYYDTSLIGEKTVATLAAGATTTVSFSWVPSTEGVYTIKASVVPVTGETDTADNDYTDGAVTVMKPLPKGLITGTVTDVDTTLPIAGATVTAAGPETKTATTGTDGKYTLEVMVGTYTVTASATGYETKTVSGVIVEEGMTVTVDFALTKPKVYAATLAGRSAWPEHHHFVISKDEDAIQTLYGKVKNIGTVATEVKVVFKIAMDTAVMETIESNVITLAPGMIEVVSASFTPTMTGKYSVSATAWYKDAAGNWVEATLKVKTFSFAVVP